MHLSDGVISMPMVIASSAVTGGLMLHSLKSIKEEEIPKISLMSGAFFVFSLVSIPLGPTSVHPLLAGLLGIMLGGKAIIALFVGLLLQALLFQHGGITTLGINTLLVALPAFLCHYSFNRLSNLKILVRGFITGVLGVAGCMVLLIAVLFLSSHYYSGGFFSVIHLIALSYLPLLLVEGLLTAFTVEFINRLRPAILAKQG